MNRSFGKLVDNDKLNFVREKIFQIATNFIKETIENKKEHNIFGCYAYTRTK